jgi:hypothetical protein
VTAQTAERLATHVRKPSCSHKIYKLDCDEYDLLLTRANECCEICGAEDWLRIDHDHDNGPAAVRGIVCAKCNSLMRHIDSGAKRITPEVADYIARSWFLSGPAELRVRIWRSRHNVHPRDTYWHDRALRAEDALLAAEAELKRLKGEQ